MTTSTKTRLELVNSVLNSLGERSIGASSTQIGNVVQDSIKEAILDVCSSGTWQELRELVTGTWSTDQCTLNDDVIRVAGVTWYTSPTGSPAASYDYARYSAKFVDLEEYLTFPLYPYTNSALAYPKYWTLIDHNVVRVNPYPNDATERAKVKFDVYRVLDYPGSDSSYFSCSDQFLNLVQTKATSLFALKYLSDRDAWNTWDAEYEKLKRKLLVYSTGLPSGGYNMYRGRRSRDA